MKNYTNEELEELVNADLLYPNEDVDYHALQKEELNILHTVDNWDQYLTNTGCDLVHESLWWDCCKVINDLAQLVLDEREKTNKIIADLKRDLEDTIDRLGEIR